MTRNWKYQNHFLPEKSPTPFDEKILRFVFKKASMYSKLHVGEIPIKNIVMSNACLLFEILFLLLSENPCQLFIN